MKFHWFHLMPYPDLPEDFRARHRSVWVDIPSSLYDPVRGHEVYNDYLDELEFADSVGFDGICINEHHQNGYGLMPSPNLMAATLTRRTQNAKIVVMGNSVALYNPPTRVAEDCSWSSSCPSAGECARRRPARQSGSSSPCPKRTGPRSREFSRSVSAWRSASSSRPQNEPGTESRHRVITEPPV